MTTAFNRDLQDVDPGRRAAVAIDEIGRDRREWSRTNRRPPAVTARQAIEVIEFECLLVWTAAFNLANGHALTADDLDRLTIAAARIQAVIDEVRA
jgi:hypothetical protein